MRSATGEGGLLGPRPRRFYDALGWALWAGLLVTIPVTSSPWVAALTGGSPVSPLAGIPLLFLVLFWLTPSILRRRRLPHVMQPLAWFVLVAILASLQAHFLGIHPSKDEVALEREIRALFTLAIGLGFYGVCSTLPSDEQRLRASLRWLYLGGFLMLSWSTVQILRLPYSYDPPPLVLNNIHRIFSIRDLFRTRVTGLAYEPSWLANQLVMLYLPLWLASVVQGWSAFRRRPSRLSLELVLLIWGTCVLFFSYSRIGLLSFLFVLGVLAMVVAWRYAGTIADRWRAGLQDKGRLSRLPSRRFLQAASLAVVSLLLLAGLVGTTLLAGRTNERIQRLLSIDLRAALVPARFPPVFEIANRLEIAERLIYWTSSFRVYSMYPLLGVGLGNTGFFFRENVPAFGTHLPEIIDILGPETQAYANPKSLWFRLLAETGILGFMLFALWLLVMGKRALEARSSRSGAWGAVATAACFALLAQVVEGFSLDSFALPQMWVILGLLTAMPGQDGGGLVGALHATPLHPALMPLSAPHEMPVVWRSRRMEDSTADRLHVSILIPCYNERRTIAGLLEAIRRQSYPLDQIEVIVADGLSTDGTRDVIRHFAQAHPELQIAMVDNPRRIIPAALNRALAQAKGEVLIRLDAHAVPYPDYVERSVAALLREQAANAGGIWEIQPAAEGWMARAIAAAASHPLGAGDAGYRVGSQAGEVDTVPFGAFRREWLERGGGYDERLQTNEDYELNVRLRRAGGRIWFDPSIRSVYYARPDIPQLWRQYYRYGFWKARMLLRYPGSIRWRQALPPLFVLSALVLAGAGFSFLIARWILGLQLGAYILATSAAGLRLGNLRKDAGLAIGLPLALWTMHTAWGAAFLISLVTSLGSRREARRT